MPRSGECSFLKADTLDWYVYPLMGYGQERLVETGEVSLVRANQLESGTSA